VVIIEVRVVRYIKRTNTYVAEQPGPDSCVFLLCAAFERQKIYRS
jgi:hypothetical protein